MMKNNCKDHDCPQSHACALYLPLCEAWEHRHPKGQICPTFTPISGLAAHQSHKESQYVNHPHAKQQCYA